MSISNKVADHLRGLLGDPPARVASPTLADPQALGTVGHYDVQHVLGAGGMGTVYRAIDRITGEVVALKVPHRGDVPFSSRFEKESDYAQAFGQLGDAPYLDHGVTSTGTPYLAMPLLQGSTLVDVIQQSGPVDEVDVLRIGERIAHVLASVHAHGVIHRDVKPANVLVDARRTVWLVDHGLTGKPESLASGTLRYAAPEQLAGSSVGTAADVYALGLTMLEAWLGEPVHERGAVRSSLALAAKIARVQKDDVRALLLRFLEEDPERRIADGACAARAIAQLRTRGRRTETKLALYARGLLGDVPFAGRQHELGLLERQIESAGVARVFGPEGIGKTRLIIAWWRATQGEGTVLAWPEVSLSAVPSRPFEFARAVLGAAAGVRGASAQETAVAVRELVGGEPTSDRMMGIFDALVGERPIVVVCDHAKTPDPDSLALLTRLRERHGRRMVIVHEHTSAVSDGISLAPLDASAMERVAACVPSDEHRTRALAAARGNPLALQAFVIEPASTIDASLRGRIQRLDAYARWLLRVASLRGLTFRVRDLLPIVGASDGPSVRDGFRRLVDARLLADLTAEDGAAAGTFRIPHRAIARVARSAWLPSQRAVGARLFHGL